MNPTPAPGTGEHPGRALPLVLIGGGGHALVVDEAADAAGHPVLGFFDDDPSAPLAAGPSSRRWLGALAAFEAGGEDAAHGWVLALGRLGLRRRLLVGFSRAAGRGPAAAVVHPRSIVSPSASIAAGAFIGPGAIIHTRARVGPHAIINSAAVVEHECQIGENTHLAPGVVLGGRVRVGCDVLVGLGSRVLPGIVIGDGAVIGAGAAVVADVPAGEMVVGVPARPLRR